MTATALETIHPRPLPCALGRGFRDFDCPDYAGCLKHAEDRNWPGLTCAACPKAPPRLVDVTAVTDRLPVWQAHQHHRRSDGVVVHADLLRKPLDWSAIVVAACPRCQVPMGAAGLCPCHLHDHPTARQPGAHLADVVAELKAVRVPVLATGADARCATPDCFRPTHRNGLCRPCDRARLDALAPTCSTDGCDRPVRAGGLCHPCYQRRWRANRGSRA